MNAQDNTLSIESILRSKINEHLYFPNDTNANILSDNGIYAIIHAIEELEYRYFRENNLRIDDYDATRKSFHYFLPYKYGMSLYSIFLGYIGNEFVNSEGKLIKRLAKFIKQELNWKLSDAEAGYIGGIITNYKPSDRIPFDVTDHFDWQAGDFGDYGSCFWGCRKNAREILTNHNCLAIRIYKDDSYNEGEGRAWLYYAPKHNGFIMFNSYSHRQIEELSNKLASWIRENYHIDVYTKRISFRVNGRDDGTVWINGGEGILISSEEYSTLKSINMTGIEESTDIECCNCGDYINEDDVIYIYGDCYCENCCFYCDHCEEYCRGDNFHVTYRGDRICDNCLENYDTCYACNELYPMDDLYRTGDEYMLCDNCFNDAHYCEDCDRRFYRSRNGTYCDDNNWRCDDCYAVYCESQNEAECEAVS